MKICEYSTDASGSSTLEREISLAELIFYLSCVGYDSASLWYSYDAAPVITVECLGNPDVQRISLFGASAPQQRAIVSFLQYFFDSASPTGRAAEDWQIPATDAACWNLLPTGITGAEWRAVLEESRYITRLDRASLAWLASVPSLDRPEFIDAVKYRSNSQIEHIHRRMLDAAALYPEAMAQVKKDHPSLFEKPRATK